MDRPINTGVVMLYGKHRHEVLVVDGKLAHVLALEGPMRGYDTWVPLDRLKASVENPGDDT